MGLMIYNEVRATIVRVCYDKTLFVKEVMKATKTLLPYERDNLINWLFYYTADKPEMQKWLHELIDNKILVS